MRVITTGSRPATDGTGQTHRTITIDPMGDATPEHFELQLNGSSVLKSGYLIAIERQGGHIVVVLTSFECAKRALRQAGQLPRFTHLLPAAD